MSPRLYRYSPEMKNNVFSSPPDTVRLLSLVNPGTNRSLKWSYLGTLDASAGPQLPDVILQPRANHTGGLPDVPPGCEPLLPYPLDAGRAYPRGGVFTITIV